MNEKSKAARKELLAFLLLSLLWMGATVPTAAQEEVQVTSADPPAAEQGTISLDVVLKGSGFQRGDQARFLVSGTSESGGITVKSTTFKGPKQLIANIDVADAATLGSFDVVVLAASGRRRGGGTELFSVIEKGTGAEDSGDPTALTIEFRDFEGATGDQVRSDGLGLEHPNCQVAARCYIDGKQKVEAKTGGEVQPNPAQIRLDTNTRSNLGTGRQLFLDLSACTDCTTLLAPFKIDGMAFVDATLKVRPPISAPIDFIFTMTPGVRHDMGLTIAAQIPDHQFWVVFDPEGVRDPENIDFRRPCSTLSQFVTVTASDNDGDGRNDEWLIEATDTTATVCGREVAPVGELVDFGQLPMTFKVTAIVLPQEQGKGRK